LHTINPKTAFARDGSHAHTADDDHGWVADAVAEYVISKIKEYEKEHMYKFAGAGITRTAASISPALPSRLWSELDIVPMVFRRGIDYERTDTDMHLTADEEADSMARKCLT
jgi:alpha,alpha-trehalose phosphorylase (configuration-retaining)